MIGNTRRCGCDCRDTEVYDETDAETGESFGCCDVCDPGERPCRWVAHFDCLDITFAQCCQFDEGCVYVGQNIAGADDMPESWCTWDYLYRLWFGTHGDPCGEINWPYELDISAKTVTYTAPFDAGVAVWTKADSWNCTEPNTLELTDADGLTGLPKYLCLVPSLETQLASCEDHEAPTTGAEGNLSVDDCGYADDADRCACCDTCCETLPGQPLFVRCGECSESTIVYPTVGGGNGLDGADNPAGVTRGASATLCGITLNVNWYCDGTTWKADVYNDETLCFTRDLTHTCCPLVLGTGTGELCDAEDCCVGIGEDCGEPPELIVTDCCPDGIPATLTMEMTGDYSGTGTLTYDEACGKWLGTIDAVADPSEPDAPATGTYCIDFWCEGGLWQIKSNGCKYDALGAACTLGFSTSGEDTSECDPFDVTFTNIIGAFIIDHFILTNLHVTE